jgi:beta-lactamase class A
MRFPLWLSLSPLLFTMACAATPKVVPRPPIAIPAPTRTIPRPVSVPQVADAKLMAPAAMVQGIRALWAAYPDRAGIAVARSDGNWMIEHRGGEPMPQQSVSKLWVAITLMDAVDNGRLRLSDRITVRREDLTVFSRAMNAKIGTEGYQTTLGDLLSLALTKSDNTANDVLLRKVGGPEAVRSMISSKGLGAIRFGGGEHLLQAGTAGLVWKEEYRQGQAFQTARALLSEEARRNAMDAYTASPPDGAAPMAIARALLRLKRGELLSPESTQRLLSLMEASETGKARLRGGVPLGWIFAHKTGTGQELRGRTAGYNDVGIMTAPDGTTYAVVVMIADTSRPIAERQQLMQGVTAIVGLNHR